MATAPNHSAIANFPSSGKNRLVNNCKLFFDGNKS